MIVLFLILFIRLDKRHGAERGAGNDGPAERSVGIMFCTLLAINSCFFCSVFCSSLINPFHSVSFWSRSYSFLSAWRLFRLFRSHCGATSINHIVHMFVSFCGAPRGVDELPNVSCGFFVGDFVYRQRTAMQGGAASLQQRKWAFACFVQEASGPFHRLSLIFYLKFCPQVALLLAPSVLPYLAPDWLCLPPAWLRPFSFPPVSLSFSLFFFFI